MSLTVTVPLEAPAVVARGTDAGVEAAVGPAGAGGGRVTAVS